MNVTGTLTLPILSTIGIRPYAPTAKIYAATYQLQNLSVKASRPTDAELPATLEDTHIVDIPVDIPDVLLLLRAESSPGVVCRPEWSPRPSDS